MDQVIRLLERLAPAGELSASGVTAALAEQGWAPVGATAAGPHPRTWRKGTTDAWLPEGPATTVEFTLWERGVDEAWGDDGLDPVYDEATGVLQDCVRQLRDSQIWSRWAEFDGDVTDGVDYIAHHAWNAGSLTFLLGARQDDTELPVVVVGVLS